MRDSNWSQYITIYSVDLLYASLYITPVKMILFYLCSASLQNPLALFFISRLQDVNYSLVHQTLLRHLKDWPANFGTPLR